MSSREEKSHARLIALRELKHAKDTLGHGWGHVSDDIRWGLLSAGILGVIVGQNALDNDEATEGELANVALYAQDLWLAAVHIRESGWR